VRNSSTPAAAIAEAAQQFGQENDIAVVTVERLKMTDGRTALRNSPILASAQVNFATHPAFKAFRTAHFF
jgi:hypothetical protein